MASREASLDGNEADQWRGLMGEAGLARRKPSADYQMMMVLMSCLAASVGG